MSNTRHLNGQGLRTEQPLLRDARTALISLADCLNSEARGIRHLRTDDTLTSARRLIERIERSPLLANPLLTEVRDALGVVGLAVTRAASGEAGDRAERAAMVVMIVVAKIERALDAYRKGATS